MTSLERSLPSQGTATSASETIASLAPAWQQTIPNSTEQRWTKRKRKNKTKLEKIICYIQAIVIVRRFSFMLQLWFDGRWGRYDEKKRKIVADIGCNVKNKIIHIYSETALAWYERGDIFLNRRKMDAKQLHSYVIIPRRLMQNKKRNFNSISAKDKGTETKHKNCR